MLAPLIQVSWKGRRVHGVKPDYVLSVNPEPGAPKGRKARHMAAVWRDLRGSGIPGIVWLDPDMAADPGDLDIMRGEAEWSPDEVIVAAHKLWPASTGRDAWVWGHGPWGGNVPVMSQQCVTAVGWFALGMTYTPRKLLDLALRDMDAWHYGQVDMGLSKIAREADIPMRAEYRGMPKHLHLSEGDAYLDWIGGQ